MMAYSAFSTKISDYLGKELQYSEDNKEILAYAIESIINSVLGFILIMALGFLLRVPLETFWAAMAGGLLRKLSGGFHCSTPARCIISGAISYSLIGWIANYSFCLLGISAYYSIVLWALGIICLVLVGCYAPVDSKAKPIVSRQFRQKLRIFSVLCVLLFGIFAYFNTESSTASAVVGGLLLQSVSLLPFLNREGGGENCE
jgi:accessory gene regulator B